MEYVRAEDVSEFLCPKCGLDCSTAIYYRHHINECNPENNSHHNTQVNPTLRRLRSKLRSRGLTPVHEGGFGHGAAYRGRGPHPFLVHGRGPRARGPGLAEGGRGPGGPHPFHGGPAGPAMGGGVPGAAVVPDGQAPAGHGLGELAYDGVVDELAQGGADAVAGIAADVDDITDVPSAAVVSHGQAPAGHGHGQGEFAHDGAVDELAREALMLLHIADDVSP